MSRSAIRCPYTRPFDDRGSLRIVALKVRLGLDGLKDWVLRWVYAQHNARVIVDFENRMSSVICEATGGLMSKPYYDADVMLFYVREQASRQWDEGYAEGRKDLADELGVVDPSPVVPE